MISPNVPKHIGIILDGNRRLARKLMLKPWKGHEFGARKVEKLFEWCKELNIKEITLYSFSIDNFNRPKEEFDFLMKLFMEEFTKLKNDERVYKDKLKVNFIGRLHLFPEKFQNLMNELMELTKDHDKFQVNFAMAYGGREEVIDATIKIAKQIKEGKLDIKQINKETFSKNLYLNSNPDLIIRTGGEKRVSDFLNFQAGYSELIFLEKMWPEFEKEDFVECINEYSRRQRRFGR